jgi:hypothetical protein
MFSHTLTTLKQTKSLKKKRLFSELYTSSPEQTVLQDLANEAKTLSENLINTDILNDKDEDDITLQWRQHASQGFAKNLEDNDDNTDEDELSIMETMPKLFISILPTQEKNRLFNPKPSNYKKPLTPISEINQEEWLSELEDKSDYVNDNYSTSSEHNSNTPSVYSTASLSPLSASPSPQFFSSINNNQPLTIMTKPLNLLPTHKTI